MKILNRFSLSISQVFSWIFMAGVTLLMLISLAGYLGSFHLLFELTSHFRVQYAIAALIPLIYFTLRRQPRWIAISLICLGINLMEIVPWYFPQQSFDSVSSNTLRVAVSNVNAKNRNFDAVISWVREENPDILAIVEANQAWQDGLQPIRDRFPFLMFETSQDRPGIGIALYSKLPLNNASVQFIGNEKRPTIVAKLTQNNREFWAIATHPTPPISKWLVSVRNRQLEAIAKFIPTLSEPVILLGDLNITMWSPIYKNTLGKTRLRNSRRGFGILPTWPTRNPYLHIPIDHCLVSPEIQVLQMRRGLNVGSDHLPIVMDLAIH
ncbi:MAG: endonuclease/exonuclease/phosphatase family protein [Limnospira sp.]